MPFIETIKPKLVTFDVTGTLLKFPMSVGKQYAKTGAALGIEVDPDLLQKNFKISYKKMLKEHPNFGQVTGIGWESWWKLLVSLTFKNSLSENEFNYSKVEKISMRLIDVYKTSEGWELANGAVELLDTLKKKHIHLGVISNYDSRLNCILKDLKISEYFDFIIGSYEAKVQKPNKGIFELAEKMISYIKPNEIVHIGDSVELDFLGAQSAGWNAILVHKDINTLKKSYPNINSNYIVKDLQEIKSRLIR
uniref:Haloacid dehalogenase-like hydrolase domain-containing protein 3 n=1 Tax=Clastoptera arizonana TaxID=38151 RepID=A0A1B6D276_9HEMI